MNELKLGLIGIGLARSMAPLYHRRAGELSGLAIRYDLLEQPPKAQQRLALLFDELRRDGYRAVNVTQPFKEAAQRVVEPGNGVAALGAVNTVVLASPEDGDPPTGYNTDFSGLCRRWRLRFGADEPGVVALIGAGGVGRAAAFAMAELGATTIRVHDLDARRADRLRRDLRRRYGTLTVTRPTTAEDAVSGVDGVMNATPVGMYLQPGAPVDLHSIRHQRWVFDAVYAPLETRLTARATEMGIEVFSGFELFLGQALDAFEHFTGRPLEPRHVATVEAELRLRAIERDATR